jgi:cardiolipin synthase A/B
MKLRAFLAFAALSLVACQAEVATVEAPILAGQACDPSVPRATPLSIAVQPEVGAEPLLAVIDGAQRTLRVMVYLMGEGPVLDRLEARAREGLDVRVILDVSREEVNRRYADRLTAAGARIVWSDPSFTFMHAKVIVADEREAMITTGNYGAFHMARERNFAVRDADHDDVDVLARLFDADFTGTAADVTCTRLLVSPINSRERLLALISGARREILVESMQLGDRDVRAALAERRAAGVDVRVVLADPNWIEANTGAATFLAESGISARYLHSPGVHVKAMLVDDARAYLGSINLSWTSLDKNREVGVIATERAGLDTVRSTFETDWSAATPF